MNPSNNIVFYRIPHFPIEDNARLFDNGIGLIGYPISSANYILDNHALTLNLITSELTGIATPKLSSNEATVFICAAEKNKLKLRLYLSNDLIKKSRFKDDVNGLQENVVTVTNDKIIGKELSLNFIFSFFDTTYSPLFPIDISKETLKTKVKSISIQRKYGTEAFDVSNINEITPKKLNIRIGLFFDGTNNSRYNTEYVYKKIIEDLKKEENKTKKFEDILTEYRNKNEFKNYCDEGSSYLNDYTNVVYLHDLYKENWQERKYDNEIVYKFYIQGIGPDTQVDFGTKKVEVIKYKVDSKWIGVPTGTGDTGLFQRMKDGIERSVNAIKTLLEDSELDVGRITFDLFGFSRGSAVARKFHNEFEKETALNYEINGLNKYFITKGGYFVQYFYEIIAGNNIEIFKKKVCNNIFFRFLGLYDTVNMTWTSPNISLKNSKAYCCHIMARPDDEYRVKFTLSESNCPNGVNIILYGCHSDIGGGYAVRDYDTVIDFDKIIIGFSKITKLYKLKVDFQNLFCSKLHKEKLIINEQQISIKREMQYYKEGYPPNLKLVLRDKREKIANDISKIALQSMLSVAKKIGVEFEDMAKTANFNGHNYTISENEKSLFSYNQLVQEMIQKGYSSNQSILQEYYLSRNEYLDLYNRYIHISSDYNESFLGNIEGENSIFSTEYINEPNKNRIREIVKID